MLIEELIIGLERFFFIILTSIKVNQLHSPKF